MEPIEFAEQTVIFAKDQPEYLPLPAHRVRHDPRGQITCCWHLTGRDRFRLLVTGRLWHQIFTFNRPLQPQRLSVEKPEMPVYEK